MRNDKLLFILMHFFILFPFIYTIYYYLAIIIRGDF